MSKKRNLKLDREIEIGGEQPDDLFEEFHFSEGERDLMRHFEREFDADRTIARIYRTTSGRPVRSIINGRQKKPVGAFNMIKSGSRSMPWESMRAELPFFELAEVATPVHSFLSQPHLLVMHVSGQQRFWRYFPDVEIEVDRAFAEAVEAGMAFDEAVETFRAEHACGELVNLVIEVKRDDDPRLWEPEYRAKLALAQEVYRGLGWYFAEVVDTSDLAMKRIGYAVHEFSLDHDTVITLDDVDRARKVASVPGATLGELISILGGRPLGLAKVASLHVRRVLMVDLRYDLSDNSPIYNLTDGMANIGWLLGK